MAEEKDDFWLKSELNNDQIPIVIDLAVALRADEVEKFLELYDNIPETFETERIEQIKEMARQLAALPKKQFDMYRTKTRILGSGDHFNLPLASTLKEKVTIDPINHINMNPSLKSGDYKNDENLDLKNVSETDQENQPTGAKSSKKKSKKKKNSKTAECVKQQSVLLHNGDVTKTSDKDSFQKQNILIENKLLNPHQSSSRIATVNRMLVADINCTVCSADSNKTFNISWNDQISHCDNLDFKLEGKAENKGESNSDDVEDYKHDPSDPPFGYPLSASKLVQSAVGLLDDAIGRNSSSIKSTNNMNSGFMKKLDRNKQDYEIKVEKKNYKMQNAPVKINRCVADYNVNNKKMTSKTMDQNPTKKSDTEGETESVDGDISNLSALEDEGWQSQARRSYRRKKKDLPGRNLKERNLLDQKNKKSFQEHRANNFKKQTSKNSANNGNLNGVLKETLKTSSLTDVSKDIEEGLTKVSLKNDEKGKAQEAAKPGLSYRDALLKNMPKPSEEFQYHSDSGVDVNSVSSCDSAIHSPEMPYEFDLKQAVNFLVKGCVEVAERQKQGKVQYYHDTSEFQDGNKKYPVQQSHRKGSGFSRPKKANLSK